MRACQGETIPFIATVCLYSLHRLFLHCSHVSSYRILLFSQEALIRQVNYRVLTEESNFCIGIIADLS